ncbi:MAG: T9SS type A sorting domain-containing protein, partial [Chitinophagales bacterium]|nr:T9SS type A sorting domain-containing protein [Chitinophagales bacterium]
MKKISALVLFIAVSTTAVFAQTPDWSTSVASIIYNNCSTCHHEGAIAPFSLMSYADAVDNGTLIQADVVAKKMPPWPADPTYNHLRNERVLSDNEISTINDWVNGGMPEGDESLAPPAPVFLAGTEMPVIDDTINIGTYMLLGDTDNYRAYVIHSDYSEPKFINQFELIAGAPQVVHHVFFLHDSTDKSWIKDSNTPEDGYWGSQMSFGPASVVWGGWVPGGGVTVLPPNMGFRIPDTADYCVAIHYGPGGNGLTDSSKLHVKFCDTPNPRQVYNERWLWWYDSSLINPPFKILANEYKTFYEQSPIFTKDMSLISVQPHMHLIGQSFKVFMVSESGDTTNLVYVDRWDFDWQINYFLTKIIKIPMTSRIYGTGVYDNTSNNPNNPSNPPKNVVAGQGTEDEMMSCRFAYTNYQSGDEDIILDSAFYLNANNIIDFTLMPVQVYPNPANQMFAFVTELTEHNVSWTLTDYLGRVVKSKEEKNIPNGIYYQKVDITNFPSGTYLLNIYSGNQKT